MDGQSNDEDIRTFVSVVREMIWHEDVLLNQRLTWMWALQALLFAAAGVFWEKEWRGVIIIGVVGLLCCISIGYSLARGLKSVRELLVVASNHKKRLGEGVEIPPTIGPSTKATEWLLPAYLLPWVFGLAWISIIALRVLRPSAG
jgi:hypothetical protein